MSSQRGGAFLSWCLVQVEGGQLLLRPPGILHFRIWSFDHRNTKSSLFCTSTRWRAAQNNHLVTSRCIRNQAVGYPVHFKKIPVFALFGNFLRISLLFFFKGSVALEIVHLAFSITSCQSFWVTKPRSMFLFKIWKIFDIQIKITLTLTQYGKRYLALR
jgi:hypothetical protein